MRLTAKYRPNIVPMSDRYWTDGKDKRPLQNPGPSREPPRIDNNAIDDQQTSTDPMNAGWLLHRPTPTSRLEVSVSRTNFFRKNSFRCITYLLIVVIMEIIGFFWRYSTFSVLLLRRNATRFCYYFIKLLLLDHFRLPARPFLVAILSREY